MSMPPVCAVLGLALLVSSGCLHAFTFSDGSTTQCVVRGVPVAEADAPRGAEFTGRAVSTGASYRILWNRSRLDALPPAVRDFLFFHECAHAELATAEELAANCAGLKAMRAAGRAGLGIEARLAEFYGPSNPYWVRTLACADDGNAEAPSPAGTSQPAAR